MLTTFPFRSFSACYSPSYTNSEPVLNLLLQVQPSHTANRITHLKTFCLLLPSKQLTESPKTTFAFRFATFHRTAILTFAPQQKILLTFPPTGFCLLNLQLCSRPQSLSAFNYGFVVNALSFSCAELNIASA